MFHLSNIIGQAIDAMHMVTACVMFLSMPEKWTGFIMHAIET